MTSNRPHYAAELRGLPNWSYDESRKALFRQIVFRDFSEALGFIVRVGMEAEKADHHPEWTNVYNCLDIWLTTHDSGGVSQLDFALAGLIDRIAEPL